MIGVTLLAVLATAGVLAMPWAFHRGTDKFRWQSYFTTDQAWIAWAWTSIVTFTAVHLAGQSLGVAGAAATLLLVDGGYAYSFRRRLRSTRNLDALCAALETQPTDEAVAALGAALARFKEEVSGKANAYRTWAQWTHRAVAAAIVAGYAKDGQRWIDAVNPLHLNREGRSIQALRSASIRIELGDRGAARQILAGASRPAAHPRTEEAFCIFEGLLEALDGDAAAALAKANRALAGSLEPSQRAWWWMVRAHALEAMGAPGKAREVLLALQGRLGQRVLRRIANQRGPASAAAAQLLASPAPYR
jgi:hypothetical protein